MLFRSNDTGIWQEDALAALQLIARESDNAPGTPGDFASFGDPIFNAGSATAFLGKLKTGGGVTKADAAGIWSTAPGALSLIARQGSAAPGAGSATYSKFTSLALPDTGGPVFLAKLKGATSATDVGIWAADATGTLTLVTREGDALTVGAAQKTIKTLQFLPAVLGVPGQTRSFNDDGFLTFRAVFTDQSEAVFKVVR